MTYIAGYHGDRHSPCLLVQGGENEEGETLSDCWIMELRTAEWKKVRHMTKLHVHYLLIGYSFVIFMKKIFNIILVPHYNGTELIAYTHCLNLHIRLCKVNSFNKTKHAMTLIFAV